MHSAAADCYGAKNRTFSIYCVTKPIERARLVTVGKPFLSPFEFQTLLCRVVASAKGLIQTQNDRAVSMDFSNLKLAQSSNLKMLK